MPKIYRVMKKDVDGKPVVDASGKGLGVRDVPVNNVTDIDIGEDGNVELNGKGMSVAPRWRDLPYFLLPESLRKKLPAAKKARANGDLHCFTMGDGEFVEGPVAEGLDLVPDSPKHGVVVPQASVSPTKYQMDLANTRDQWNVEE